MSNKKLLVDLSKSIMPSTYSNNPATKFSNHHPHFNGSYFHSNYLNGSKILSHFSSPRSSRSSCSTYSSSNSCSTSCKSSASSSVTTSSATSCSTNSGTGTSSSYSLTNGSPKSTSSSRISLNLSSSSHTCDSSDCNSNCSKAYGSSSILSTSISNNSNSESSSSSYYSTDDHDQPELIDELDDEKNSNKINNSYICNSSPSSGDNSINTTKTNSTTIGKLTRSTSRLSKQNDEINAFDQKPVITTTYDSVGLNNKVNCMWSKCKFIGNSIDVDDSLLEHIKSKHIFSQKNLKTFRCMWKECGVFKKPSCSFNWLERHVTDHIDTRPFLCIFNGCKRKFRTEVARERHVQSHINISDSQPTTPVKTRNNLLLKSAKLAQNTNLDDKTAVLITTAAAKLQQNDTTNSDSKANLVLPNYNQILKALSKKRKALTSESASKKFKTVQYKDYIDDCTASVVDSKLKMLNCESGQIVLKASVIGIKPKTSKRNEMLLVQWSPSNILENEWIEKSQFSATKTVNINDLKLDSKELKLTNKYNQLYRCHRHRQNKRK